MARSALVIRPRILLVSLMAFVGLSAAQAAPALAGWVCYWPQENYTLGCSSSLNLASGAATGWRHADGSLYPQVQVKVSVFSVGAGTNPRVRAARVDSLNQITDDSAVSAAVGTSYFYGPVTNPVVWRRNLAQALGATINLTTSVNNPLV